MDVEDGFSDGGAASAGDSLRIWVQQDLGVKIAALTALEGEMSSGHWRSYGALLAKVHATAVTDALAKSLPREDHTQDQVRPLPVLSTVRCA